MAKKPTGLKTYTALTAIVHDGDRYARGEQLDLTDDQARQLLEGGIVKPFLVTPKTAPTVAPVAPIAPVAAPSLEATEQTEVERTDPE